MNNNRRNGVIALIVFAPLMGGCAYLLESSELRKSRGLLPEYLAASGATKADKEREIIQLVPESYVVLRECVEDSGRTPADRAGCVNLVSKTTPLRGDAAAIIQSGLKSKQADVERAAIYAAASFGFPFVETFIPSLQQLLQASDPSIVRAALGTLGSYGPVALPAIPSIEPLTDKAADALIQVHARVAIARIQGAQDRAVLRKVLSFLDSSLSSDDPAVRASTVHGFGQLGRMARPSVGALLQYLKRQLSAIERLQVAISLLRIGTPSAQRVADRIIAKSRESNDPGVRAAVEAITVRKVEGDEK